MNEQKEKALCTIDMAMERLKELKEMTDASGARDVLYSRTRGQITILFLIGVISAREEEGFMAALDDIYFGP